MEISWENIKEILNFVWLILIPFIWNLRGKLDKLVDKDELEDLQKIYDKKIIDSNQTIIKEFGRAVHESMEANNKMTETMDEMNKKLTIIEKSLEKQEVEKIKDKEILEQEKSHKKTLKDLETQALERLVKKLEEINKKTDETLEIVNKHQGFINSFPKRKDDYNDR